MPDRLFTPRFFLMCGFTFTVFLSAFQLLPTAPFRILALGGSTFASGLFLGFLTYASAFSAPLTGSFADRLGSRRVLAGCSLVLTGFSLAYAVIPDYRVMLALVLVHGVFWSGLLSASSAYLTNMLPERRRAEGIGYWGLSSVAAIAVAPPIGFWVLRLGWSTLCVEAAALNVAMCVIAWTLPVPGTVGTARSVSTSSPGTSGTPGISRSHVEWRVLLLSLSLFLYSFGYGGITSFSAMYADENGVAPRGLYLTSLAVVILITRPISGRFADRVGYRRVLLPSLALTAVGLGCLAVGGTRFWMLLSAIFFGAGFGTAYPVFVGYVMQQVAPERRGAGFGAILAAFDTGIGTGSTTMGWIAERHGFSVAFAVAAALAALSVPYFLAADRLMSPRDTKGS